MNRLRLNPEQLSWRCQRYHYTLSTYRLKPKVWSVSSTTSRFRDTRKIGNIPNDLTLTWEMKYSKVPYIHKVCNPDTRILESIYQVLGPKAQILVLFVLQLISFQDISSKKKTPTLSHVNEMKNEMAKNPKFEI